MIGSVSTVPVLPPLGPPTYTPPQRGNSCGWRPAVPVAAGRSNDEIARDLVLSGRTVARHVANIYGKIGVHNRAQATAWALRHKPHA